VAELSTPCGRAGLRFDVAAWNSVRSAPSSDAGARAARGTRLAATFDVRPIQRKVTILGVGSSLPSELEIEQAFNDDDLAPTPISGTHARVSCPPPSTAAVTASTASTRYTFVAPRRRQTLSMLAVPVPSSDEAPVSRRRPTLRTYEVQRDVRDSDADGMLASG
jgi:hypothetical protein